MRSKPRTFICLLATVFLLTACSGIKERETNRLLVLHKRYSGSVIRIAMETENGWLMGGTAFYTGQETGFITARHCLMYSDSQGEEHQFDSLMLHIPSCESGYKANMGEAVNEVNNYAEYIENDWQTLFQMRTNLRDAHCDTILTTPFTTGCRCLSRGIQA